MKGEGASMQSTPETTKLPTTEGARPPRPVPRRKGHPLIGSTIAFQKDQIGFVTKLHEEHGDVVCTRIVDRDWYFVRDPDVVHAINVRRAELFVKPALAKQIWHLFLGPNSVLTQEGPTWQRLHDLIKPAFHRFRIEAYAPLMVSYVDAMLRGYRDGERRDVREDINNVALEIVGKTLFDTDMARDRGVVFSAMHDLTEMLVEHINLPLPVPRWWPSKGNRRKIAAIEAIESVMWRLLESRRLEGKDHGDLLSGIVFARDAAGRGLGKNEMRDNLMTLIFAGHETTAHSATWAWYLLAKHPDVAAKLHEEIARVVGTRPLTVKDLDALPYLTEVVKESLRLLPAVWAYMRAPTEDVTIEGYTFPKQSHIFISPYVLGRDARSHPDPLAFTPERWTREYERGLRKGAYVPFAAGPRVCLGQGFAQMEMKILLGTMIQNLVPKLEPGFTPDFVPELSLHPGRRGLRIEVVMREDAPIRRAP